MDYEKALEKARAAYGTGAYDDATLEFIFPELNGDETVRQALLDLAQNFFFWRESYKLTQERVVAYLEKQKGKNASIVEVLTRAGLKPYKDGNKWCILAGDNIQEGICGFGDTVEEALYQFLIDVLNEQKKMRPAEWSEEDKRAIDRACVALRAYSNGDLPEFLPSELLGYADRLQSLRPLWRPSEEQMKAFKGYIKDFQEKAEAAVGGWNNFDVMIRLYEQLKKL